MTLSVEVIFIMTKSSRKNNNKNQTPSREENRSIDKIIMTKVVLQKRVPHTHSYSLHLRKTKTTSLFVGWKVSSKMPSLSLSQRTSQNYKELINSKLPPPLGKTSGLPGTQLQGSFCPFTGHSSVQTAMQWNVTPADMVGTTPSYDSLQHSSNRCARGLSWETAHGVQALDTWMCFSKLQKNIS